MRGEGGLHNHKYNQLETTPTLQSLKMDLTEELTNTISDYKDIYKVIRMYKRFDYLFFNKHRELYTQLTMTKYELLFSATFKRYVKKNYDKAP